MRFKNRREAGRALAKLLTRFGEENPVVLGLPRGGVPVAYEVAMWLTAPLDVFIVRKLGVPGNKEAAFGAIASGGVRVIHDYARALLTPKEIESVAQAEMAELQRRETLYRKNRPALSIEDRAVLLIDDGLATGASMRAAVLALRRHHPRYIVVGVPVASPEGCEEFRDLVDEIICVVQPQPLYAVGMWYDDFSQTTDREVQDLLHAADRAYSWLEGY
ncbi:MAG: phosphoribosyltransferase [Anaerolineae bacterium]